MESNKVYIVVCFDWMDGLGLDDYVDKYIDSIWSRKEDAKIRIDDLANEFIRHQWYDCGADLDDFECHEEWKDDKTLVVMSTDPYSKTTYYMKEFDVNPLLPDFEGP